MFKANNGIPRQVKHLLILLLKQKQTKLVSHRCLSELPPLRLLQCNSVHLISYLGPSVMFIRFCFCFCCSLIFFFLTRPPVPRLFLVTTARRHASLGALKSGFKVAMSVAGAVTFAIALCLFIRYSLPLLPLLPPGMSNRLKSNIMTLFAIVCTLLLFLPILPAVCHPSSSSSLSVYLYVCRLLFAAISSLCGSRQ